MTELLTSGKNLLSNNDPQGVANIIHAATCEKNRKFAAVDLKKTGSLRLRILFRPGLRTKLNPQATTWLRALMGHRHQIHRLPSHRSLS